MEAQRLQKKVGAMVCILGKKTVIKTISMLKFSDNTISGLYTVEYMSDLVAVDIPSFVDKCLLCK